MEQIEVNEKAVERLKRKIILQENQNLKTRTMTDQQMVAWIKKQIEEEAQCYIKGSWVSTDRGIRRYTV